ncbi:acetyltransferase [Mucilaginibacter jinjuensis]|uniref:Acetyltransferase n=1 Tax=Mucilaginibacter jinjuensis TaxID=1176721 RepID=A0ABY7T2D6_9SPHI|nr:acetyltransferase [Mucilaginibacter jinjuensis]WCT10610.1 acetyltransferase [Mucilaginibacter jinjuensis]
MDKIVIWGASGQAIVLEELLAATPVKITAFFENNEAIQSPIETIPIYYFEAGFERWLSSIEEPSKYFYSVAIGGNNGNVRAKIGEMFKKAGLKPYTAIHHTAFVAGNSVIGEGAQILANSNVCARAKIGKYCILNTASSVDHECIIGDNVHIGPGAKLAGCITVGDNSFIGTNATVLPRIIIGKNVIIGAGAVVTKNVADDAVIVGNPGRQLIK